MLSIFIFRSHSRDGSRYGIGAYVRELVAALRMRSYLKIFMVSFYDDNVEEYLIRKIDSRTTEICIPPPLGNMFTSHAKKYARGIVSLLSDIFAKEHNIVCHFNSIDSLPIIEDMKKRFKYPIVFTIHCLQWQLLFGGNWKEFCEFKEGRGRHPFNDLLDGEFRVFESVDKLIGINSLVMDYVISHLGISKRKIRLIRNGIEYKKANKLNDDAKRRLKRKLGFRENEQIVLFAGRIDDTKGVYHLVDAFIRATVWNDEARLVLVGDGDMAGCLSRISKAPAKLTFTGYVSKETLCEFYQIADLGVVPSLYDYCPLVLLEMVSYEIPTIVSGIQELREVLTDDDCFFLKPVFTETGQVTFNTEEFASIITLALSKESEAHMKAENAYRRLLRRFSSERMASEMIGVYKGITSSKR